MKRVIALRQRFRAFGRGSLEFVYPANRKVLAFIRRWEGEQVLVVANLSRHAQFVELDLSSRREAVPVELFGGTEFPAIGERPYVLTLGPHSFYWFELRPARQAVEGVRRAEPEELPRLEMEAAWADLFVDGTPPGLEGALHGYLASRPWLRSGRRRLKAVEVVDAV